MRRAILVAAAVAVAIVPAVASGSSTTAQSAAQKGCRAERTAMGKTVFAQTYGTNANRSNAFGKCVSKHTTANVKIEKAAKTSASASCTAERTADPAAFAQKYGSGKNDKNAYGKCVSQTAKAQANAAEKSQQKADVNAAKVCKAERTQLGNQAFADKYGTNHNKRNAFGKCVSQHAKAYSVPTT
jgi:hypothetical protein